VCLLVSFTGSYTVQSIETSEENGTYMPDQYRRTSEHIEPLFQFFAKFFPNESFGANQIRWKSSWEIERSSRSCVEPACPMTATSGNDNSKKIMLVLS
jgi:hypothetical protein